MSRPCLAPSLLGLLLLAVGVPALAQNGRNVPDACPAEARESTDLPEQDPERTRAAALRAKYSAWPAITTPPADTAKAAQSGGGSSEGEEDVPRLLNSKWHSFLPGMFR